MDFGLIEFGLMEADERLRRHRGQVCEAGGTLCVGISVVNLTPWTPWILIDLYQMVFS